MVAVTAETLSGERLAVNDEHVERLRTALVGSLLTPEDRGYDEARILWNGMHDRRPALIARCTGTADIVAAVNFARDLGLRLTVRGGGHNVSGTAIVDGALVVDLSLLRGVYVDPARRVARVQPGARWADVDRETQLFGLATTGGEVSTTGVAGFTLSGGLGILQRKFGLACDNLISAQVVTAAGEVVHASESDHPDLFWAIRGGGGNFGIVSSFEFRLHEFGPEAFAATLIYPHADGANLLRNFRRFTASAPDEVTSQALIWSVPALPELPVELHDQPAIIVVGLYAGSVADGEQALQPLRELGEPIVDWSGPAPYVQIQSDFDPFFEVGNLYYWKSIFGNELTDELIDLMLKRSLEITPGEAAIAIRHMGGAVSRVPEEATAFGNRSAQFNISLDALWQDPAHNDANIAWVGRCWDELKRITDGGVYLNFAGFAEDVDSLARAGHQRNYERLREVKRHYDPLNLFRSNINIKP